MRHIKKIGLLLWMIFPHLILIFSGIFLWWYLSGLENSSTPIFSSLASGIISGLITALLLFVFAVLWRKNIEPWFENLLYQDVCIEGEWFGILIPYLGLEDLDRAAKKAAWRKFQERIRKERKVERGEPVPATSTSEQGNEKEVSAELILHKSKYSSNGTDDDAEKHIKISIAPAPILIRVEISRVGHKVSGRIIEIGGASKVHTYTITGGFKNLILSGCYETCSKDHIDRGALSLMLKNNGKVFEGFFSSYGDTQHAIKPMQCVLKKKNQLSEDGNGI